MDSVVTFVIRNNFLHFGSSDGPIKTFLCVAAWVNEIKEQGEKEATASKHKLVRAAISNHQCRHGSTLGDN